METEEKPVSKEVKAAAKLMDKVVPGWHQRVNVEKLQMQSCEMCLLGQTFGEDVETGIAKELYPAEWQKAVERAAFHDGYNSYEEAVEADYEPDGYTVGRMFFKQRARSNFVPHNLEAACEGEEANQCGWIAEIMDRRAADDARGILPTPAKQARRKKR